MPRGRLPTGIVATIVRSAGLMTVTSPDRSLLTQTQYGGGSFAATSAGRRAIEQASENAVARSKVRIIDEPLRCDARHPRRASPDGPLGRLAASIMVMAEASVTWLGQDGLLS